MTRISTGTNISSLIAQRLLQQSQESYARSLERLSTGMRINRASDDAAGLAVASTLEAQSRIYGAGIRNVNDGISALNVAEGGLSQLSTLVTRMKELATQAANGSYSSRQRQSLNSEANALVSEYNRITQSTTFNGRSLLSGTFGTMHIQAGQGAGAGLDFSIGSAISKSTTTTTTTGGGYNLADFEVTEGTVGGIAVGNGGAKSDQYNYIVTTNPSDKTHIQVVSAGGAVEDIEGLSLDLAADLVKLGDFNGDGFTDMIFASTGGKKMQLALGDGAKKFTLASAFDGASSVASDMQVGDFDGDDIMDVAVLDGGNSIRILTGDGSGGFKDGGVVINLAKSISSNFLFQDLNDDGFDDIVIASGNDGDVSVYQNTGGTAFGLSGTIAGPKAAIKSLAFGDIDTDGHLDLVVLAANGELNVHRQTASFVFGKTSYTTTLKSSSAVRVGDVNGDGRMDLVVAEQSDISVLLGNEGFAFDTAQSFTGLGNSASLELLDINSDGLMDVVGASSASSKHGYALSEVSDPVVTSTTTSTSQISNLDLTTQSGARSALTTLETLLDNINREVGNLGAGQSRLQIALNLLTSTKLNYEAARSRIVDADVAFESANLLRQNILQQAGAAVLGQANLQPQLVLSLLRN